MKFEVHEIYLFMETVAEAKLDLITVDRIKEILFKKRAVLKQTLENYSEDIGSPEHLALDDASRRNICEIKCLITSIDKIVKFVNEIMSTN